jgi:hypothetical protein
LQQQQQQQIKEPAAQLCALQNSDEKKLEEIGQFD